MSTSSAVACVASALVLSACTSHLPATAPTVTSPPASTAPGDPFTSARSAADAPEEIRTSPGTTSCGAVVLDAGTDLPPAATTCLEESIGRARAELAVAQRTTEGDPVVTFYLTRPDLVGYDVVVDQRQDPFSSGGFARYRCAGAKALDDLAVSCAERQ